tara:strand:- start:26777 stop:27211 length:435 start_codon:yes stop_codon:yes gene_type:complete
MQNKIVAIASDHAGFSLKQSLIEYLHDSGYIPIDLGTNSEESVDYPVYALEMAQVIESREAELGILICGTGIGISIAANRNICVRAALCRDDEDADMARKHNDANVVALAGRRVTPSQAKSIVSVFLNTDFEGGRHARRVEQIS